MTLEWIRFGVVAFCFTVGLIVLYISVFGTFRFRFALNRIHASAMTDTLVLLLFVIGMVVAAGPSFTAIKFLIALALQWCTSPISGHLLAKFEYFTDERLHDYCTELDLTSDVEKKEKEERT